MKTCPECAEEVREAARLCRYCGHRFEGRGAREQPTSRTLRHRGLVVLAFALLAAVAVVSGALASRGQPSDEASTSASTSPPPCSKAAVSTELERRNLLESTSFSGVQDVSCRDVTGDGIKDATFVRMSTGSAGTLGWGVLVAQEDGNWALPLFRENDEGVDLAADDGQIMRRQPIYRPSDPHCCPTGGTDVEVYDYRAGRFEVVKQYETGAATDSATDVEDPKPAPQASGDRPVRCDITRGCYQGDQPVPQVVQGDPCTTGAGENGAWYGPGGDVLRCTPSPGALDPSKPVVCEYRDCSQDGARIPALDFYEGMECGTNAEWTPVEASGDTETFECRESS